jgi:uncharacterized LabA/DUF88 family protein
MKKKRLKTYVFIDASNIIYGASDNGWKMDFAKLFAYLKKRFKADRIFYYAGLDKDNLKQIHFYEKMQEFGYSLRLVPVKIFKDGKKKADIDSRMTFEMMKYFSEYENTVIFTGDGDYYWVLEYLILHKKLVKLFAHTHSTAKELKKLFGEEFTDLSRLKDKFGYKENKK